MIDNEKEPLYWRLIFWTIERLGPVGALVAFMVAVAVMYWTVIAPLTAKVVGQ